MIDGIESRRVVDEPRTPLLQISEQGRLSLIDCRSGVPQRLADVLSAQLRKVRDDLLDAHALGDHRDDRGHGNSCSADARDTPITR